MSSNKSPTMTLTVPLGPTFHLSLHLLYCLCIGVSDLAHMTIFKTLISKLKIVLLLVEDYEEGSMSGDTGRRGKSRM